MQIKNKIFIEKDESGATAWSQTPPPTPTPHLVPLSSPCPPSTAPMAPGAGGGSKAKSLGGTPQLSPPLFIGTHPLHPHHPHLHHQNPLWPPHPGPARCWGDSTKSA